MDIALTKLFGGFPPKFYEAYESYWPLPPGHEQRRTIYNLYQILNHYVHFGGLYMYEAKSMINKIMKMK